MSANSNSMSSLASSKVEPQFFDELCESYKPWDCGARRSRAANDHSAMGYKKMSSLRDRLLFGKKDALS